MTTRWISGTKTWCEDCQKFFYDNAVGRKKHMASLYHQQMRQQRINNMTKESREKKFEEEEVRRELERVQAKAHHQSNADYHAHRKSQSVADQYSTYRPEGYAEGYTMSSGGGGQNASGGFYNGTNYYDADFLELQRQKLYGVTAEEAEKFRQAEVDKLLGKEKKDDEAKEGEGDKDTLESTKEPEGQGDGKEMEAKADEPYDPNAMTHETLADIEKRKQEEAERRMKEGFAGRYEVVSASAMLGYGDQKVEEDEEEADGEPIGDDEDRHSNTRGYVRDEVRGPPVKKGAQIEIKFGGAPKRKRGELEEEDLWAANLLEGKTADHQHAAVKTSVSAEASEKMEPQALTFAERVPEKPLFQALEDEMDDGPVEFKRRKLGTQNSRKKK